MVILLSKLMSLRIISLNVQRIRNKVKRRTIYRYGRDQADIICLSETYSCAETQDLWKPLEWGSKIFLSHGDTNSRGVAILINKTIDLEI